MDGQGQLTTPEAAYLAGIVDGEGTIGIYKARSQHYVKLTSPTRVFR